MKSLHLIFLLCSIALSPLLGFSAPMNVVVHIQNTKGIPLPGEKVEITHVKSGKKSIFYSDIEGLVKTKLIAPADYTVKITTLGAVRMEENLELKSPDEMEGSNEQHIEMKYDLPKMLVLEKVEFETGQTNPTAASLPVLDELVKMVALRSTMVIQITGHTDMSGDLGKNQMLSEARANSIKEYLIKKGIPPANVHSIGMGANQPRGNNQTAEGRKLNRRIEVLFLTD